MNQRAGSCFFGKTLFFAFLLAIFSGIQTQASTELARVNGRVITLDDFNKHYKDSVKFFQITAPSKKGVLDDLVKRELGLQEAKRLGIDKDPEVLERINTVVFNALLEKKLAAEFEKIHVSDEEAEAFYAKNPEIRTSQLFVALKPNATAKDEKDALARIKAMEEEVREGKSFAEVAQRLSDGPTAPMGGDMDYQTKDRLDPVYYETAVKLKSPGKTSGIIRSAYGYHVIKLTGVKTWDQVDKALVKRLVLGQRKMDLFEKYMKALQQKAKIVVHEELLKE